jgi:hypothetical protein
MIDKILDALKEGGCKIRDEVPLNEFNDKFIDVNGIVGCARDLTRLGREDFLQAYTKFTTLTPPPE